MRALKYGELFAGYMGLGMGVQSVLPGETVWVSDFDRGPSQVLAHHLPAAPNYGDITRIKWTPDCPACSAPTVVFWLGIDIPDPWAGDLGPEPIYWCHDCGQQYPLAIRLGDPDADRIPEPVDVMTGGSPCQDLSTAGARRGMTEGTRSNLWVIMREGIAALRPRLVVWENVRGAYSAVAASDLEPCSGCMGDGTEEHALRALGRVLGDLDDLRRDAVWIGLRAADVGDCHSRFRVILTSWLRGELGIFDHIDLGSIEVFGEAAVLPTPLASESDNSTLNAGGNKTLAGTILGVDEVAAARLGVSPGGGLLPTPTAASFEGSAEDYDRRTADNPVIGGPSLGTAIDRLLPTPNTASSSDGQTPEARKARGHGAYLEDLPQLLPTVKATNNENRQDLEQYGLNLGMALLPTPNDFHIGNSETPEEWLERREEVTERTGTRHGPALPVVARSIHDGAPLVQDGDGPQLIRLEPEICTECGDSEPAQGLAVCVMCAELLQHDAPMVDRWGPYAAAVHRWEQIIGREAPEPTIVDENGKHRLNPLLTEWMMGVPEGHITAPEIWTGFTNARGKPASAKQIRDAQLKLCGNGVVPQQAAEAVRRAKRALIAAGVLR